MQGLTLHDKVTGAQNVDQGHRACLKSMSRTLRRITMQGLTFSAITATGKYWT